MKTKTRNDSPTQPGPLLHLGQFFTKYLNFATFSAELLTYLAAATYVKHSLSQAVVENEKGYSVNMDILYM